MSTRMEWSDILGKQIVKVFYCGKYLDYPLVTETIEDQMNRYLQENPVHRFTGISTHIGVGYKEAFVIIDTGEPTTEMRSGYISTNNDPVAEGVTTVASTGSDYYRYEKKNKNQNQNKHH